MVAALDARPAEPAVLEDPTHGYAPLSPGELHGLLATRLEGTSFRALYQQVSQRMSTLHQASDERASV